MSRFRDFAPRAANLDEAVEWLLDRAHRLLPRSCYGRFSMPPNGLQIARSLDGCPDLLPGLFRFWSLPRFGLLPIHDPATVLRILRTAQISARC